MRTPFIAGNWKMNKTISEGEQFLDSLKNLPAKEEVESAICAPFIHLPSLVEKAKVLNVGIGAENAHEDDSGAFTGEVSVAMLQDLGVDYIRSEEHTSELQSRGHLVCRLLLEKKNTNLEQKPLQLVYTR